MQELCHTKTGRFKKNKLNQEISDQRMTEKGYESDRATVLEVGHMVNNKKYGGLIPSELLKIKSNKSEG